MIPASSRMLQLLSLLQTRRLWPGELLSERLDITPRTVRRDVDRLRELGYRIDAIKGPAGGYRLEAGSELPPLLFDDEQALALAAALRSAPVAGLEEASARALAAVRQVLPERLRHRLDALRFTAVPPDAPAVTPETLVAVSTAVRAREVLRFDYGGPAPRRVEPHHLVSGAGRWYLVAWDLERDDWRVFRADRLAPRTPTGPRFARRAVPGGDVRAFLDARFRGGELGGGWPCTGTVTLRRPARDVAPYVDEGSVEDLGAGRCRVMLGAWSWEALAASFGRFDSEMSDVEPAPLAAAFGVLGRRFSEASGAPSAAR